MTRPKPRNQWATMGRPPKFPDADELAKILAAIAGGASIRAAFARHGIADRTVRDWRSEGQREPEGRYGAFADALEVAVGQSLDWWEQRMRDEADPNIAESAKPRDWRAVSAVLQMRFPEYGKQQHGLAVNVTGGAQGGQVVVVVEGEQGSAFEATVAETLATWTPPAPLELKPNGPAFED